MSVQYLKRLIRDQINRAQSLKDEIPHSPRHAALEDLATSCKITLEEQVRLLRWALSVLDGRGGEASTLEVLTAIKYSTRAIVAIEGYGMPPLHCQSKQAVFLNSIVSTMHSEIGLQFPRPAVSCTSSEYYFAQHPTNTIYAPLSEAAFLLHMPDFYHELGHLLLAHPSREAKSRLALAGTDNAVKAVDKWYLRQAGREERKSGAVPVHDISKWARAQWMRNWIYESFCDLFALFASGPAYAYSNLLLVSKRNEYVYRLDLLCDQGHPADEARVRLLDAGMRLLGHEREAQHIRKEWDAMAQIHGDPPPEYGRAFPSPLLQEIAEAVLAALGRSGLRGYSSTDRAQGTAGRTTVAVLLNDAWRGFWDEEEGKFRDLERELVARLAAMSRNGTA